MDFLKVSPSVPLANANGKIDDVAEVNTSLRTTEKMLLRAYKRDLVARAVLNHFANLEGDRNSVDVNSIVDSSTFVDKPRPHIIRFLKQLEKWKLGNFKAGRRGHDSRFESPWNLKLIGQRVSLPSFANERAIDVEEEEQNESDTRCIAEQGCTAGNLNIEGVVHQSLDHRFMLRPDYLVNIQLPVDFSIAEASRLADFIKALPFS